MPDCNKYMAKPKKIEVGDEFGKWTVTVSEADSVYVDVVCDCGTVSQMTARRLRNGVTRQCKECVKREMQMTSGFLTKSAEEKANKKYPKCDPDKEQDMIQEFLNSNPSLS